MKYYLYISDAKVDMLWAQMPHVEKSKLSTEIGLDVKLFKASRKTEMESEEDRYAKLKAVTGFLEDYGDVGSIQAPGEYFRADTAMTWLADNERVMFGAIAGSTVVALIGSARHIVGGSGPPEQVRGTAQHILEALQEIVDENDREYDHHKPANSYLMLIPRLVERTRIPTFRVEFLAKRFAFFKTPDRHGGDILVGSPMYVALAS